MKKFIASILFIVCSIGYISAQLESWHWQEAEYHFDSDFPNGEVKVLINYWIKGDTVFGGIGYKKLYRECVYQDTIKTHTEGLIYPHGILFCIGIREDEQGRIYISKKDYFPSDYLLYDFFDWSIGDTVYMNSQGNDRKTGIIS